MNNRELYDEIFAHVFTVDKSALGGDTPKENIHAMLGSVK